MNLPQVEQKSFTTKLISSNKNVKFKTLRIGEQKQVMMIRESSNNEIDIYNAIIDMVQNCVEDNLNIKDLYLVDFAKLFYSIRAYSEGNEININTDCKCKYNNKIVINVAKDFDIVNTDNFTKKIKIPNTNLMFELRQHKMRDILKIGNLKISEQEKMFDSIAYCIEKIYKDEEIYFNENDHQGKSNTYTIEEAKKWVEKLPGQLIEDLNVFFNNAPDMKLTKKFKCQKCGKTLDIDKEGFGNFL